MASAAQVAGPVTVGLRTIATLRIPFPRAAALVSPFSALRNLVQLTRRRCIACGTTVPRTGRRQPRGQPGLHARQGADVRAGDTVRRGIHTITVMFIARAGNCDQPGLHARQDADVRARDQNGRTA